MKLTITDDKKIREIQLTFNKIFPFLQIEFFSGKHKSGEASPKICIFDRNKTIGECRSSHTNDTLEITPELRVSELEKELQKKFGLSAQVFRKSGRVWLETISTDYWTLGQQNRHGEEMSTSEQQLRLSY